MSLGLLPDDYLVFEAPRRVVFGAGALSVVIGFMILARDHRAADATTTILLLSFAAFAGWLTFYAPDGTIHRFFPFIPLQTGEALSRLLFGLGCAATFGLAIMAVRRLLR